MKIWSIALMVLAASGFSTQVMASPASERCAKLAASPVEDGREGGPGVDRTGIIISRSAVPACKSALAELPNDPVTQYRLARALWAPGIHNDDELALYWAVTAANQGYPMAQYGLALAYLYGYGAQPEPTRGVDWLRRAAEQKFPPALDVLAEMYLYGGTNDGYQPELAAEYYAEAAELGWVDAKYTLGWMLIFADEFAHDEAKARGLLLEAAKAGHAQAQWQIGSLLLGDDSTDKAPALRWLRKAAAQGLPVAVNDLGYVYSNGIGVEQDDVEAIAYFRQAAELGDVMGQHSLAHFLFMGRGGPRDLELSAKWMKKAALQDRYVQSQYWLAVYYSKGWGVPKDMREAEHWFRQAARNGEPECIRIVTDLDQTDANHEQIIVDWLDKLLDAQILAAGDSPEPPVAT